jgi:hypothetical protein
MFPRLARLWIASRCLYANEVGVNLKNGRGGDLTSREAGSGYERIPLNEPKPRCIQGEFNFV